MPGAATTDLSEILRRARALLEEPTEEHFTDEHLTDWVNEGMMRLFRATKVSRSRATFPGGFTAGENEYDLPADCLFVVDVTAAGKSLHASTRDAIADTHGEPLESPGTPTDYWVWGRRLFLYPVPDTGGELCIWYYQRPDRAEDEADTLQLPDEWTDALVNYVVWRAFLADHDAGMASIYRAEFEAGIRELEEDSNPPHMDGPRIVRFVDTL